MRLNGLVIDLGDVLVHAEVIVKGQRHLGFALHIGAAQDTTLADRVAGKSTPAPAGQRKVDVIVDFPADKKATIEWVWTDELMHPVPAPEGQAVAYSIDDGTIINLTDNGDGTAVAAATGVLGQAILHVEASAPGVILQTADEMLMVVAGGAERGAVKFGPFEEVTPDV